VRQSREALNEVMLAQFIERSEPRDFLVRQSHLTRPTAAGRTAFAIVKDGHGD